MFKEKIDTESKKKPSMCQKCRLMPCNKLYWIDFIVLPGFFDIPLNCPKRIRDIIKAETKTPHTK